MSTSAIVEQVRAAHEAGTPLRVVAAGTWLDAGTPVSPGAAPLDVRTCRGIVEYVPGDLTLTAAAGTTLAEIADATAAHGQRLALDPYGTDAGTLGATLATASAGPLAGTYGTPRDVVLGLTFVSGTGETVRAGGRVVKNVAGFDLVRLLTGAWGTLGVVTEATVRLRAIPPVDASAFVSLDASDEARVSAALGALGASPFAYDAAEMLDEHAARRVGLRSSGLLVRMGGTPDVVRAMHASLAPLGAAIDVEADTWARLRAMEPAGAATLRLSARRTDGPRLWHAAQARAARGGGWATLAAGRTVARVTVPRRDGESDAAFDARITAWLASSDTGLTVIPERLPPSAWRAAGARSGTVGPDAADRATRAQLARGVRDAFDPRRVLNRGLMDQLEQPA